MPSRAKLATEKAKKISRALTVHGMIFTTEYIVWSHMRDRCNNPNHHAYKYYGGRGIRVCKRWNKFKNFLKDMGNRPIGMTLDRKNNNSDYKPSNCRWATWKTQNNNRRDNVYLTKDGLKLSIGDWALKLGLKKKALESRIKRYGRANVKLILTAGRIA